MNSEQLRQMVRDVLLNWDMYSGGMEELLLLTAAVESDFGKYWRQVGGPAEGIFQMEPATTEDMWNNYVWVQTTYKPINLFEQFNNSNLLYDLEYQIVWAALHYIRSGVNIPEHYTGDDAQLARIWKNHWNTHLGMGSKLKAIQKYRKYVKNGEDNV